MLNIPIDFNLMMLMLKHVVTDVALILQFISGGTKMKQHKKADRLV